MRAHQDRLHIHYGILAMVNDAVETEQVLRSSPAAEELAGRYPNCGMTVREIEDSIILQVGLVRGVAEMGRDRQPRRLPNDSANSPPCQRRLGAFAT